LGVNTLTLEADGNIEIQKALAGTGGIEKTGAGTLTLKGVSTVSGPLTLTQGTLALRGGSVASASQINITNGATLDSSTSSLTIPASQTLTGSGTVLGDLIINGTLSPGNATDSSNPSASIGTLTFGNTLSLAGTTVVEISKDTTGTLKADKAKVTGAIHFGGTLMVTNLGTATLTVGDAFDLFDASSFTGKFSDTLLPTLTSGLSWNTTTLSVDGTVRVEKTSTLRIQQVQMHDGQLSLQIATTSGAEYVLESTPSLTVPIVWTAVSTNTGNGDTLTLHATTTATQQFYRITTR
jgi:autotransporter-associated beta strand protein